MPAAVLNGVTLAWDDQGSGADVLLLVHGHPFDRSMWRPQLEALRDTGWRVLAPDLRGYGESQVVPGRTTLDCFAGDLAALLDHLGIERVVIAGLSMGGQIAMEFCRTFPERVRGVALLATHPVAETDTGRAARNAMADRLLREGMDGYARETLPKMVGARALAVRPAVGAHVLEMMRSAPPAGAAAALRGRAERPGYEPTLASLAVPALIVVGDEDAFTTRAQAELMHRLIPRRRLLWLSGVGHMPNLEAADPVNAALSELLAAVPA